MEESNKSMLAERLIELRKLKGLSQYALADKLGYSRGLISNYEQGRREPDYNTLQNIADFFDVSIDWLLGRSSTSKKENNIINAVSDDKELLDFTRELMERETMQLLFKQVKPLPDAAINKIIKIIKAIEDEESVENGINNN